MFRGLAARYLAAAPASSCFCFCSSSRHTSPTTTHDLQGTWYAYPSLSPLLHRHPCYTVADHHRSSSYSIITPQPANHSYRSDTPPACRSAPRFLADHPGSCYHQLTASSTTINHPLPSRECHRPSRSEFQRDPILLLLTALPSIATTLQTGLLRNKES